MPVNRTLPPTLDRSVRRALHVGFDQLVRRQLRGVWVNGRPPVGAVIWASNHHSWWDYFVARAVLSGGGRSDVDVLVDPASIDRRSAWARGGAIGTDRLRSALQVLDEDHVLVVFPEGSLRPAGEVGDLRPGAGWLAARSGAELRPVATRVVMRGQQAPEAYVDIGPAVDPSVLSDALHSRLRDLDSRLAHSDPMRPLPGFTLAVRGTRSWHERLPGRRAGR